MARPKKTTGKKAEPAKKAATKQPAKKAAAKPAPKKASAKQPSKKQQSAKKPAKQPATKAAAKRPAAKQPAKQTAARQPAKKQPARQPAKKQPARQPAKKQPAKQPAPVSPAAEAPAAESPAAAAAEATPTPEHLAQLAMNGDLEVLFGLMDGSADSDRDALAYKWLSVASDFGHEDADEMIGDLLEVSSLRYDDDQYETGNAHWELGLAYLTGTEGLPHDLDKARGQLANAKERGYPMSVQESEAMLMQARARLAPDALSVFEAVYDGSAAPGVIDEREDEGDEDDDDADEDEE